MDVTAAIKSLRPEASFTCNAEDYNQIVWMSPDIPKPSEDEVSQEIARLQAEHEATEYQRLRAAEYPDFKEYLDGIVKGDNTQVQAYIEACKAVKEKYPKPVVGIATTSNVGVATT